MMPTGSGKHAPQVESSISFLLENKAKIGRIGLLMRRVCEQAVQSFYQIPMICYPNRFKYGYWAGNRRHPTRMEADMSLVWFIFYTTISNH